MNGNNSFRIFIGTTLFKYNIFNIPVETGKQWEQITGGTLEIDGKTYQLTISGKGLYILDDNELYHESYRAFISGVGNAFEVLFCHTFMTLQSPPNKNNKNQEYMDVEYSFKDNRVTFKAVNIHTVNNEYTGYFKELAKRNKLALSTKHDNDLKKLIQYSSAWIPISELDKHKTAKNCIYTWIDIKKKYIYIGKADDLYTRMTQHKATPKNEANCINKYGDTFEITHFSYKIVNPFVAETLIEALEMFYIQNIANFVPNRSKGKQEINCFFKDSEWTQINNQYSYH